MKLRKLLEKCLSEHLPTAVVGCGISGIESALFLRRLGLDVALFETRSEQDFLRSSPYRTRLTELDECGVELHFGKVICDRNFPVTVLSPGVPLDSQAGETFRLKSRITNDVELALSFVEVPHLLVTGSNGKTTTSKLCHHLLKEHGVSNLLVGNVGVPLVSYLNHRGEFLSDPCPQALVVEISSFQIETLQAHSAKACAFLNCSPNHLDRHKTFENYFRIKSQLIAMLNKEGVAVLNQEDSLVWSLRKSLNGNVLSFGEKKSDRLPNQASIHFSPANRSDFIEIDLEGNLLTFDLSDWKIPGLHNRYNLAAALLLVSTVTPLDEQAVSRTLQNFSPAPYRFEPLSIPGQAIINDSKSTTVASTIAAVRSFQGAFPGTPFTLLVGGVDKGGDWGALARELAGTSQAGVPLTLFCYGRDRQLIARQLEEGGFKHQISLFPTLREAVERLSTTPAGVLFSPGCASFDEFGNFEERGFVFRSLMEERQNKAR